MHVDPLNFVKVLQADGLWFNQMKRRSREHLFGQRIPLSFVGACIDHQTGGEGLRPQMEEHVFHGLKSMGWSMPLNP
jgi:hypothetical protein